MDVGEHSLHPSPMTQTMTLRSGATLAWAESGDPQGLPVIFLHGWPASRLQGAGFGPVARELGIRIIAPDRPGIGLSTYVPGRQLLDWPPVVAELADHLQLDRFRMLAVSGGGPYAFAAAHGLGSRSLATAVVSGAPPLHDATDPAALLAVYRWLLAIHRRQPWLLRAAFRAGKPFATMRPPRWLHPLMLRCVSPGDAAALADSRVFDGSWECYREAWQGSGLGVVADAEVYAQPWGFEPEDVQGCIRLWHGGDDRSFNAILASALGARLPCCTTRIVEGEGHYSLPIRHGREILEDLMRAGIE